MLSFAVMLKTSRPFTVSRYIFPLCAHVHIFSMLFGKSEIIVIQRPKLVKVKIKLHPAKRTKKGGSGLVKNVCW